MADKCPRCGSWKVKNANYCWNCGYTFKFPSDNFETELNIGHSSAIPQIAAETGMILILSYLGILWAGWPLAMSVIPPFLHLVGQPLFKSYLNAPKPEHSIDKTTLKVEYKTDNNRHWQIDHYPQQITYRHLEHVAKICVLDKQSFSRRNICKTGLMSQEDYRRLHTYWRENNLLFIKPNNQNILTPRCQILLKKALPTPA